jgi:hypothetical protein
MACFVLDVKCHQELQLVDISSQNQHLMSIAQGVNDIYPTHTHDTLMIPMPRLHVSMSNTDRSEGEQEITQLKDRIKNAEDTLIVHEKRGLSGVFIQQQGHRNTPTDLTCEHVFTLNYLIVTQQKGGARKRNTHTRATIYLTITC